MIVSKEWDMETVCMNTFRMTEEDFSKTAALRHELHRDPELSGQEYRTTQRIKEFLSALPGCRNAAAAFPLVFC